MAFRGFTRRLAKNGGWLPRVALGDADSTPAYPPLYIKPSSAPSGTASAGDMYVDSTTYQLKIYDGDSFVSSGGDLVVTVKNLLNADCIDQNVFVADRAYQLVGVREVHGTASSDGGAVTLDVVKLTGTTAPASGTTMLSGTINMKGTANTVVSGGLTATAANLLLAVGDRIGFNYTGTVTALADVNVTLVLRPV